MANSTSHAALPYPIRNARFSLALDFRVAAGTPTDPTTPDTEFSTDGGATFSDCAEEITTGGSNGAGYLTLTGAETNCDLLIIAAKSANDLTTPAVLYPRVLAAVGSGTLSAGSAGGGTLGTLLAYDVTGCFIRTTGGTGGGGTGGANNQARLIVTYNTSTGAFTVTPNWAVTPSTDTTYDVLLPEGVTLGMLRALNPATPGRALVVDSSGLADANMVKGGPSGSGVAITANTVTHLNQIYDTDYGTIYDATNKAFLSKLGNFAMGGSSLALTLGAVACTAITVSGAVALQSTFGITGATTFTGAVTASNSSNNIVGVALTSGERTAIANEVESQIIDDTDSEKVLTAITDKIASVNPSLGDLTVSAIASAVWSTGTRVLTAGTNIVLAKGVGITGFNDIPVGSQMDLVNAPNATAVAAIQNGLATSTALTDLATTAGLIKTQTDHLGSTLVFVSGSTYRFTAAALALGPSGSSTVVVTPVESTQPNETIKSSGTTQAFRYCPLPIGPISITDANGPVSLDGNDVKMVCVKSDNAADTFTLTNEENGGLLVSSNQISVDYTPEVFGKYKRTTFRKPPGGKWDTIEFGFWNILDGPDPR